MSCAWQAEKKQLEEREEQSNDIQNKLDTMEKEHHKLQVKLLAHGESHHGEFGISALEHRYIYSSLADLGHKII